uniref:FBA_2 domain-containing protein n=1 Tax=Caenorhabditis tropicalis TaxID=1561998 RepID=A0A1I7T3T9_9PELO
MALHHYICDVFNLSSEIQIRCNSKYLSEFPDTRVVDNLEEHGRYGQLLSNEFYESIQVKNCLGMYTDFFIHPESHVFSVNHLLCKDSAWVRREHLLQFRGRSAVFCQADLINTSDVIEFIDDWLNGSNTKLELMLISNNISFNKKEILERFDVFPWDPKKRGGRFRWPPTLKKSILTDPLDCTQGMDIERESDGMLATLIIHDNEFRFYVWHERFPDPSTTRAILYKIMGCNMFYVGSVSL